jgi:hypothetical protein
VCINFKTVSCLVDTGAVASYMSETFAKTLKLTPSPALQELQLISANQSPIHSLGVVEVDMSIQGLVIPFCFYVIRSLSTMLYLDVIFLNLRVLVSIVLNIEFHYLTVWFRRL